MRQFRVLAVLLLLLATPALAEQEPAGPRATFETAQREHQADLLALAEWCQSKKLFGRRDAVYERVLSLDPDQPDARKWLKYERQDGEWVQDERYRRPTDFNRIAAEDFRERYAGVLEDFDAKRAKAIRSAKKPDDVLWALEVAEAWLAEEPSKAQPSTVLRTTRVRAYQAMWSCGRVDEMDKIGKLMREAYPGDNVVDVVLEEEEFAGSWVLKETREALVRRLVLGKKAREMIDAVPDPREVELTEEELGLAIPALKALGTQHMRLVATGPEEHRTTIAKTLEAAGPFLAAACFHDPKRRPGARAFVFGREGQADQLLERVQGKDSELLKQREEHGLDAFWLDGQTLVVDKIMPKGQVDLATSLTVYMMLADTYFRGKTIPGWIDEGIARHVTYMLTGTRMTIGVGGRYGSGDRKVPESYHDWLKAARDAVAKEENIDLRLLLGKQVDAYSARDSIVAYAFAVYLLDGAGLRTGMFLESIGSGNDPDKAARKVFHRPLAVMEYRFRRWLDEMVEAGPTTGE